MRKYVVTLTITASNNMTVEYDYQQYNIVKEKEKEHSLYCVIFNNDESSNKRILQQ